MSTLIRLLLFAENVIYSQQTRECERLPMNSSAVARLLKQLSPDIIELNEETLLNAAKRRPMLRQKPLEDPGEVAPGAEGKKSDRARILEDKFLANWTALGGPILIREFRFDTARRWRFDFALPDLRIAFEIQGGLYAPQTGHRSLEGVQRDYEKINAAQLQGWKVFQLSSHALQDANYLQILIDFVCDLL